MIVRKMTLEDMARVGEITDSTRIYFKNAGSPQWQGEYPSNETFSLDISRSIGYVCDDDGSVCGFCAIVGGDEPDYANIYDGEWKNDRKYISLHRVAVAEEYKGKGVAALMVEEAVRVAKDAGVLDIRCDTHEKNTNMRRMLEKNGFCKCGTVYLCKDGTPRVAYQKILD